MSQTTPKDQSDFGTSIWQTRTVAQILYSLPTLGMIDLSKHPSISIVFADFYVNGTSTADFKCTLDIESYLSPMYIAVLKNSTNRRFSTTNLTYGDVLSMKCKTLSCVHVQDDKYEVNLEIPGLYLAVEKSNSIEGCVNFIDRQEALRNAD